MLGAYPVLYNLLGSDMLDWLRLPPAPPRSWLGALNILRLALDIWGVLGLRLEDCGASEGKLSIKLQFQVRQRWRGATAQVQRRTAGATWLSYTSHGFGPIPRDCHV